MTKEVLQKIKNYRFLFEELVKRDFKKKYKRTALGRVLISNCVNDRIRQEFPTTAFVIISIKKSKSRLK